MPSRLRSVAAMLLLCGCSRTPVTDRVQLNVLPDRIMTPLSASTYKEMLAGEAVKIGG